MRQQLCTECGNELIVGERVALILHADRPPELLCQVHAQQLPHAGKPVGKVKQHAAS